MKTTNYLNELEAFYAEAEALDRSTYELVVYNVEEVEKLYADDKISYELYCGLDYESACNILDTSYEGLVEYGDMVYLNGRDCIYDYSIGGCVVVDMCDEDEDY